MAKSEQSIEPMIADLVNGWLKSYNLDYKIVINNLLNVFTIFYKNAKINKFV